MEPTPVEGVLLLSPTLHEDERGFFARTWDRAFFKSQGMNSHIEQSSISYNREAGTLRGMHYQSAPHQEAKLVRCTAGAVFDVALDLRPDSPTYLRWFGAELSAANRWGLYIPEGCAHGFLTLLDHSEVLYDVSAPYEPSAAQGVRFDDPAFEIRWPAPIRVIKDRDASYPDYQPHARLADAPKGEGS